MSEILNKFKVIRHFPLKGNIKYFYVSIFNNKEPFGYCVLYDNRVYGFGHEIHQTLGYNKSIEKYVLITELSDKNIQEFYEGGNYSERYMLARNDENQIFYWGWDRHKVLVDNDEEEKYLKPNKIDFFDGKNIIKISCGINHYLALSSDGLIYGWGYNGDGQFGGGERFEEIINTPIEIGIKEKIKSIHCARDMSFAVSFKGNPYYWGRDNLSRKTFTPKLINLNNVLKVYSDSRYIINILDNNGKIFEFNERNQVINEIEYQKSNKKLIEENGMKILVESDFDNFFDSKEQKPRDYKKTFELTNGGHLMIKVVHYNESVSKLNLLDKYFFRTYELIFEEIREIDRGCFGQVYLVKQKTNNEHFAIKKVELDDYNQEFLNEIKILSEQKSEYVVQYIDSWIDGEFNINCHIKRILFIQMELCSHNLRYFIDLMIETYEENFEIFYYFISCELFKELIECVNYLHSLPKPIIHRDLKPKNILISVGINGRFLKLCDFGLAKFHDKSSHTRYMGTYKYMAPEVRESRKYNTKCDIYSLALIATEIFRFDDSPKNISSHEKEEDFDKYLLQYSFENSKKHLKKLLKILSDCLLPNNYNLRPDCQQLLENINEFSINKNVILKHSSFNTFMEIEENIILKFFKTKIRRNLSENLGEIKKSDYTINEISAKLLLNQLNSTTPQHSPFNSLSFENHKLGIRLPASADLPQNNTSFLDLTILNKQTSVNNKYSTDITNSVPVNDDNGSEAILHSFSVLRNPTILDQPTIHRATFLNNVALNNNYENHFGLFERIP